MSTKQFLSQGLKTGLMSALVLATSVGMLLTAACYSGGPQHVEVSVKLEETGMTPNVVKAKQGDTVTLKIQAHEAGEIHLHGYDIEKDVTADGVTELAFTATATGRFKLTFHAAEDGHAAPPAGTPAPAHAEEEEKEVGFLEVLPT
ncbi:MAG: hypothetical protein EXR54_02360 [Dehalococcoidia bacterium]|nr:hypothetical protein [Dehalococcoidia bacterium]